MASLSGDTSTRFTPQFDTPEEALTDQSHDTELAYDTPLPDISPSISPAVPSAHSSALRTRLDPILTSERDSSGNAKRKKRRRLKQSPSIQLETASSSTVSRALPPLETGAVRKERAPSKELPPLVPLAAAPDVRYEPIQLLSDDDISQLEYTVIGNPVSSHSTQPEFLLKSEKAFFEKKDGRFAPVSKQETPLANPTPLSCPVINTILRENISIVCNYIFNTFGLVAYSLLTGLTICHTVFVFTLAALNTQDLNLVLNISKLSLPLSGVFYFLTSLSIVYIGDRADIPRVNRKYIRAAIHNRKLSVLLNIIALFLTSISLILTLSLIHIDLQIHYFSIPGSEGWNQLWSDLITNTTTVACPTILFSVDSQSYSPTTDPVSTRVTLLKSFLLVRAVLCLCGWLIVISTPTQNRWFSYVNRVMREEI